MAPPTGRILLGTVRRMEQAEALDGVVRPLSSASRAVLRWDGARHVLRGRWLGHTFHALLTDFVEGPWMAASFLDAFGPSGSARAARQLLGLGLAVAPLAHLTGLADWEQASEDGPRRVGAAHGLAVSVATALYAASYVARRAGRERGGRFLGFAGGIVALGDGYLGGHLSHVRGVAVGEQTEEYARDARHPAEVGSATGRVVGPE